MPISQAQADALLTSGSRPLGQQLMGQLALARTPASGDETAGAPAFTYETEPRFNNEELVILSSAVRAATVNGVDRKNYGARGIILIFDQTVVPGVQTVTPKIQGKDPASGKYYDILVGAAQVGIITVQMKIYPGLVAAANVAANDVLPKTWRVVLTHSGAGNFTYSVGGILLL